MKILIADPDRDFLDAFSTLLTLCGHKLTTVFDGTQVITKLTAHRYHIVVLNENIPRIPARDLIKECRTRRIPVIVLSERPVNSGILSSEPLANAYLSLPFLPNELLEMIGRVLAQQQSQEKLLFEEAEIEASDFSMNQQLAVTEGETAVFRSLLRHEPVNQKRAVPYIAALNHKFARLRKNVRIRYLINDGYRLVKLNYE